MEVTPALIRAFAGDLGIYSLPFAARFAIHTGIWTLWLTVFQYVLLWITDLLRKSHLRQTARAPQLSQARMLWEATVGFVGWTWPLGLFVAWLNPGAPGGWVWDYSWPTMTPLIYFCLVTLAAYDTWSFFAHRWMHKNKTAFVWLHAKHHEHHAALDVRTAGYMSPLEGLLSDALPMVAIYAFGAWLTGNFWYSLAGVWHSFHIVLVGHCGHDVSLTDPRDLPLLALNPMAVGLFGTPVRGCPMDHEEHHNYPRTNFSFFFTYWDDLYGTAHKKHPPTYFSVLLAHLVYQFSLATSVELAVTHSAAYVGLWLLLYVCIPPRAAAAAADAVGLPELVRRLLGWFMDMYRRDSFVTYEPVGSPGAFVPSSSSDSSSRRQRVHVIAAGEEDDTAPVRDQQQPSSKAAAAASAAAGGGVAACPQGPGSKPPVYLFACHPTGLISRGAFLTFAARGWHSPVSALPKVRLAVASGLLQVPWPFYREMLLACGCIPAERDLLKRTLQSGTSVALTPGGWAESQYLQSYKLVLKRRQGFVALAAETGAHLVPVLCLGEQELVGAPEPGFMLIKWVVSCRVKPLHVVFGEPVVPRQGESVSQLHSRYVEALMALGKQHDVKLQVVE